MIKLNNFEFEVKDHRNVIITSNHEVGLFSYLKFYSYHQI